MRSGLILAVVCAALINCAAEARADGISVISNTSGSEAYAPTGGRYTDGETTTGDAASSADNDRGVTSFSETDVEQSSVTFTADWTTEGDGGSWAQTTARFIFTVDGDLDYGLSGSASFEGGVGHLYYSVRLLDVTSGSLTTVFFSYQESRIVDGEDFTLGGADVNYGAALVGDLSGQFIDGHDYEVRILALTSKYGSGGSSLTGSMDVTLTLGSPVPEPGSIALLGLGLAGLALARRRRKAKAL